MLRTTPKPPDVLSSSLLQEIQDLTSLSWNTTLSDTSPVGRDVTTLSRDVINTSRDVINTPCDAATPNKENFRLSINSTKSRRSRHPLYNTSAPKILKPGLSRTLAKSRLLLTTEESIGEDRTTKNGKRKNSTSGRRTTQQSIPKDKSNNTSSSRNKFFFSDIQDDGQVLGKPEHTVKSTSRVTSQNKTSDTRKNSVSTKNGKRKNSTSGRRTTKQSIPKDKSNDTSGGKYFFSHIQDDGQVLGKPEHTVKSTSRVTSSQNKTSDTRKNSVSLFFDPASNSTLEAPRATAVVVPQPRDVTTAPRDVTTAPRDFTTAPRDVTTAPRDVTTIGPVPKQESPFKSEPEENEEIQHIPVPLLGLDPQFWLPVKMRIRTVHLLVKPSPLVPGLWVISNHPLQRVKIMGLVTGVEKRDKFTKYKIEDTSGALQCVCWNTTTDSTMYTARQYKLGDLVCVKGKVGEFRGRKEVKVTDMFDMDDMNQLTLHLALSDKTMKTLEKPFTLPDTTIQCHRFKQKITDAVVENVLQKGPCRSITQYKEIQNVNIWLRCLTALQGCREEDILLEIHGSISASNSRSTEIQERKQVHNEITTSLHTTKQVDTKRMKRQYPRYQRQIDAVISQLLVEGDIYEVEYGLYSAV